MAHAYWRLYITGSGGAVCSIAEFKFFDSGGTQIATTGGTPSASSTFSPDVAANAFDGNASTFWASSARPTVATPQWLRYQFASAADVASFSLTSRPSSNIEQSPLDFALQYSDDGATWTTLYQCWGVNWLSLGQVQTFDSSNAAPSSFAIAWRLLITSASGGSVTSIAEWKMYDSGGSQIATSRFAAPSSSVFSLEPDGGYAALDGNVATYWASNANPTVSSPQWLAYQFASTVDVVSFSVTARIGSNSNQAPHDFKLQKSTDGTTWIDAGSFTATTWASGSTQTFGSTPTTQQPIMLVIT